VRSPVLLADVRLELDDPAHATWAIHACRVGVTDQSSPKQGGGRLERRPPDERGGLVQRPKR
jgi:hypothetical protein